MFNISRLFGGTNPQSHLDFSDVIDLQGFFEPLPVSEQSVMWSYVIPTIHAGGKVLYGAAKYGAEVAYNTTKVAVSYVGENGIEYGLYATKYGARALYVATTGAGYTLKGASYGVAGMSYVPHGASKLLEMSRGSNESDIGYRVTTCTKNLMDFTSGALYAFSYVPDLTGEGLFKVSNVANELDKSLTPEKIHELSENTRSAISSAGSTVSEAPEKVGSYLGKEVSTTSHIGAAIGA